jgi:hypothetical protein
MGNDCLLILVSVLPNTDTTELPLVPLVLTLLTIVKFAQHLLTHGSASSVLILLTHCLVPQLLAHDVWNMLFFPCQSIYLSFPFINRLLLLFGSIGS